MTNSSINSALNDLKKSLNEEPTINRYRELKTAMENDSEIKDLAEQLKSSQQDLAQAVYDDNQYKVAKKAYEDAKERYNNHPIVVEYNLLSSEVEEILKQIANIIND